ncbi:methyltransferase PMT5 [Spatholobus suberectus]|nr:methyltransferase PMT5 [Spatholobus suberectus]
MRSSWFNKLSIIIGHRPPLNWLFLCLISLLVLIVDLGSSSSNIDPAPHIPVSLIYTNYRRVKEQAAVDYLELRSVVRGVSKQREFDLCGKERENFVPCYNVSANLLAGFKGEEFDRHCELLVGAERCLVRPPKEYKIPLQWPTGRDIIWSGNVKITKNQFLSSGSMTKRLMLLEENQIAFHSEDGLIYDDVKDYSRQLAEMIGLGSDNELPQAGVRTILDINCGFGSFAAHLASLNIIAVCIAAYEATGSQVQLALERGLPAVIGNFIARQLPYPSLSYDMVHCAQCGIIWDEKDGMFLIEVDRVLKPGGYFVLTSPEAGHREVHHK